MPTNYIARMWLTCDSASIAVLAEFDKRWTRAIERAWSTIVVPYDNDPAHPDLIAELDSRIEQVYTQIPDEWIPKDLAKENYIYQSLVPVFESATWSIGTGGAHEGYKPIMANVSGGTAPQWRVYITSSVYGYIYAHVSFVIV